MATALAAALCIPLACGSEEAASEQARPPLPGTSEDGGDPNDAAPIGALGATIPAMREWTPATGAYRFGAGSRIVIAPSSAAELRADADTIAEDLAALTGTQPIVLEGDRPAAQPGDIFLSLGSTDAQLGAEGYLLEVGPALAITARTANGAFMGSRSLLQLLKQSRSLLAGVARDWATYPERGVRMDTVSRTYSPQWWHNFIRELSYAKLNLLTVMVLGGRALSDDEIRDLVAYSRKYHIELIPTLAVPSHADPIIFPHAELRLFPNLDQFTPDPGDPLWGIKHGAMDFTKDGALAVIETYIDRYIKLFPNSHYWHTGGDEYLTFPHYKIPNWDDFPQLAAFVRGKGYPNATGADAFTWLLNWMSDLLEQRYGKELRVWNDSLKEGVVKLKPSIVVEHWEHARPDPRSLTPQDLADPAKGNHRLLNVTQDFLYHDQGLASNTADNRRDLDARFLHDEFAVDTFSRSSADGPRLKVEGAAQANLAGAMFAVWMVNLPGLPTESDEELSALLFAPLRSLAQVTWGSPRSDYGSFRRLADRLGRAPSYVAAGVQVTSDPGAVAWRDQQHVFARAQGGSLEHWWWQPGQRPNHDNWGGALSGRPSVFAYGNQIHTFARGPKGSLAHWFLDGSSPKIERFVWDDANISGDPIAYVAKDQQHVFARGATGELRHWFFIPGQQGFLDDTWPGKLEGRPTGFAHGEQLHVFARGPDGVLNHWFRDPLANKVDQSVLTDTKITGDPVAYVVGEQQHVFARSESGELAHWFYAPGAGFRYDPWGGKLVGSPDGFAFNGEEHVFARGDNGVLRHWFWSPAGGVRIQDDWGVDPVGDPAVFAFQDQQHAFARAYDGATLQHWYWIPNQGIRKEPWGDTLARP
jgi:hexosaminidase